MQIQAKATDPSVRVRFPESIKKSIVKAAIRNGRSFNSEVIARLARSLESDQMDPAQGAKERIA